VSPQHPQAGHGPGTKDIRLSLGVNCRLTRTTSDLQNIFHIPNPSDHNPDEVATTATPIFWNSVEIELYTDPHFHHLKPVYGSQPGDLIYVKAYTRIQKHNAILKMKQCYLTTHPKDPSGYFIMRDG
jgi:hypothetical protein